MSGRLAAAGAKVLARPQYNTQSLETEGQGFQLSVVGSKTSGQQIGRLRTGARGSFPNKTIEVPPASIVFLCAEWRVVGGEWDAALIEWDSWDSWDFWGLVGEDQPSSKPHSRHNRIAVPKQPSLLPEPAQTAYTADSLYLVKVYATCRVAQSSTDLSTIRPPTQKNESAPWHVKN